MSTFHDLLSRLAAEYSTVCIENEQLRSTMQLKSSPNGEYSATFREKAHLLPRLQCAPPLDTSICMQTLDIARESNISSFPFADGHHDYRGKSPSLRCADHVVDSIVSDESIASERRSTTEEEVTIADANSLPPSSSRLVTRELSKMVSLPQKNSIPFQRSMTGQPVDPCQCWYHIVQALLLIAAEPHVHIDVRDAWVPTRSTKGKRIVHQNVFGRFSSDMEQKLLSKHTQRFTRRDSGKFAMNMCMLDPQSQVLAVWKLACVVFTCYDTFMAPLEFFFALSTTGLGASVVACMRLACYSIDILINFSTGYYNQDGRLVMSGWLVAARYINSWFALDITLLMLDAVSMILDILDRSSSIMRVVRYARIIRLSKLLRVARIAEHLQAMQFCIGEFMYWNSKRAKLIGGMVSLASQVVFAVHCLTCMWYGLGSAFNDGWVNSSKSDEAGLVEAYFNSCEWAIALIHGTARIYPLNLIEHISACVARLLGFWIMACVVASITNKMAAWRDEKVLHLQEVRSRYVAKHKISAELNARVHDYFRTFHMKRAVQEALQQEMEWLSLLPIQLQKDLHEEARARIILIAPVFRELSLRCHNAIRRICYEAISCKAALWMERVFVKGDQCSDTYFVESGMLVYNMSSGDVDDDKQPLELAVAIKKISQSRRCLCEAALWASWQHCGDLIAMRDCLLLALDVHKFATIILSVNAISALVQDYAKRYVFRLNVPNITCSDVLPLCVPFTRTGSARNTLSKTSHLIFLSHYKVEAGTEATLMRDELRWMIEEDPYHPASDMKVPVFLDSEDLENLMELESHISKTTNLVVLLTPTFLQRPWCLIECVRSMENGINVIPVRVERPDMTFEFPTETSYYENLRSGQLFNDADIALFRKMNMELSTIEKAVKQCFINIVLPFSPHKPLRVRRAELAAILERCNGYESI